MFVVLLGGVYSAYKHFSGLDPLKLDPQALATNLINAKDMNQFFGFLSAVKIGQDLSGSKVDSQQDNSKMVEEKELFKFLAFADSHSDNISLRKAINQAKEKYPDIKFIVGLGDYTEVGTLEELKLAKAELDLSGLRYFLIPGDHDLWDSRDKQIPPTDNFKQTFGPNYQSFIFEDYKFLLLDNSDNYKGIGEEQMEWIVRELEEAKEESGILVFAHEALFHPSSDRYMGKVESSLKQQAKSLIFQLKAAEVSKVFAGDVHFFGEYLEPETSLSMVTVGAVTSLRNPQASRYAIVRVLQDGSIKVEDVEVK